MDNVFFYTLRILYMPSVSLLWAAAGKFYKKEWLN